jgi:hypothetical protein
MLKKGFVGLLIFVMIPFFANAAEKVSSVESESGITQPSTRSKIESVDGLFPRVSKRQVRPAPGRVQTNSPCTTSCNCRFDCRIQSGMDRCTEAPASNCKYLASDCENCGSCVCF